MRLHPVHKLGDVVVHTVVQGLRAGRQQVSQNPPELGERVVKFLFLLGFFLLFLHCMTVNFFQHVTVLFFFFFFTKVFTFFRKKCHR